MTLSFEVPPHTLKKQHEASNPGASVWVSANAGSGKTHVLTQRVVRLLLRGVAPSKILCLTFTKAAAANMAARVYDTLALWTRLGDDDLRESILATGAPAPSVADATAARKLFARTVETPGGLKIQTIHAFCEKLLHLFPFEANVPSRFEVADESRQAELLSRARRETLADAATGGDRLGAALARITDDCGAKDFEALIEEALAHRAIFVESWPRDKEQALRKALGLAPDRDLAGVERDMIEAGMAPSRWREIAAYLDGGKVTDKDRALPLREAARAYQARRTGADPDADCLAAYLAVFFIAKGEGTPAKVLVTKDLARARPDIEAELYAEQARLDRLRAERKSAATFERTRALMILVEAIFSRYETMKSLRGVLDFDDLIERTLALLERSESSWVLYKLDRGIDHVLVDEAQDTSADQWKILDYLTSDFASGSSRSTASRTFFAVGDEKQSIFSFQGAAPRMFGAMRRKFERTFLEGGESFAHVPLTQSFRSVPGVLAAVDKVFGRPEHQRGLVADDIWMGHEALKSGLPGLVEIWPAVGAGSDEDQGDWRLPLDFSRATDPASVVAQRIARKITRLLDENSSEHVFDSETRRRRPIRAGDILILVRTRNSFFEAMIRALKQSKIPVAGADRLELSAHIAVMDLIAAGRAALLSADDLTLACVLKSPLIGLDDDDLLAIAPGRSASLADALAGSAEPRHARAFALLLRWRDRASLGPFGFYSRLLGEDGGRRALEARLGTESCDAIDEFLRLALAFDKEAAPSLVTFLDMVESMNYAIKRDMETGADAVRVMTVHAAKGLEAKIVFLPDTCGAPSPRHDPKIFALGDAALGTETIGWSPRKDCDCGAISAARDVVREAAADEYRRLLYVALTRAEERLYIAGFHGPRPPEAGSWAVMIEATLARDDAIETLPAFWNDEETIARLVSTGRPSSDIMRPSRGAPDVGGVTALPEWLSRPADFEPSAPPPLRPANALASSDNPAEIDVSGARRAALQTGRLMHILLQYLSLVAPDDRREAGLAYLAAAANGLDLAARENLATAALGVLDLPSLADLFGPGSKAEVAIAGKISLPSGARVEVSGQVDRIGETESEVFVADFKTGAPRGAEETPRAYLAQMALYRAVLAPLWPRKRVRMLLIWTAGPFVAWLDDDRLDRALALIEPERLGSIKGLESGIIS